MQRREPAHFGAPARAVSDFLEDELHAGRLWRFLPSRISSLRLERARCHRYCSSPLNRVASVGQVAFDVAHRLFQRARHVGVCELILVLQKLALTHVEALGLNEVQ